MQCIVNNGIITISPIFSIFIVISAVLAPILEEDDAASITLAATEEEVNQLRKSIALKEGELSSLKELGIQEDKAVEEMEQKRLAVEAEIHQLRNLEKEEGEKGGNSFKTG